MKQVWEHCPALKDESLTLQHLEQWMRDNDARLKRHEVEVPRSWRRHVVPDAFFPAESLYVLGEAVCGGIQQHGWVEIDGVVFDGVMQQFYSKAGYDESEKARPWYRFDRQATMWIDRAMKRQVAWTYRWDRLLGLPWADYDNPMLVDLETAKCLWHQRKKWEDEQGGDDEQHKSE